MHYISPDDIYAGILRYISLKIVIKDFKLCIVSPEAQQPGIFTLKTFKTI